MPPKAHAWVGPSSIARVLACPPSARFSEQFPETPSEFAAEGTEAHEYCEYLVRKALGEKVRSPKKKLKFYNAEMQECADGYAAFIMELYETAKLNCNTTEIMLEQRVDVSEYIPECFGTADCIIVSNGTMTIADYKHGMGVKVEATDNPQLKTYALGALAMFDFLYDIKKVRLIIYQPRLENVDEWEIGVSDLLEWAEKTLKPTAQLAYNGEGEFCAGNHCRFCKAKAVCRKRAEQNLLLAQYEFAPPDQLEEHEIPIILSKAGELVTWANDVREFALAQALSGVHYDGYKLVEGRSNRKYTDKKAAAKAVENAGYNPYGEPEIMGITAMEKLLGKKRFSQILGGLVEKPKGAPTLVPKSDKRPVYSDANEDFKDA
ncbi:MAG: DUF2800 domain-containing protein [Alistipes sp.]|nr:DUF2800 domain-containing protein [Alistipes sp.]